MAKWWVMAKRKVSVGLDVMEDKNALMTWYKVCRRPELMVDGPGGGRSYSDATGIEDRGAQRKREVSDCVTYYSSGLVLWKQLELVLIGKAMSRGWVCGRASTD